MADHLLSKSLKAVEQTEVITLVAEFISNTAFAVHP